MKRIMQIMGSAAILTMAALSAPSYSHAQGIVSKPAEMGRHAGEFMVPISKSQVLELDVAYDQALVGNPEIADILPLTDRSVYVLGKKTGSTSLTFYDRRKQLIAVLDLVVAPDIDGLKKRLYELMPDEEISIRPANGSVILSGAVANAGRLDRALAIAETFAPERVINLLGISSPQQVLLEVRFSEIQRTTAKQLGLNFEFFDNDLDFTFLTGNVFNTGIVPDGTFGLGSLSVHPGASTINILFDTLEEKGLVKTLAEPTLVARSGDTASFLAGGEFPVPVAQSSSVGSNNIAITVQFREFGVSLAFTPTVLEDGLISLDVAPEVSAIDPTTAVVLSGFNVPGLQTRRASTTVELRDGESFAIAGLLQSDFQDTIRQFPVLGDIPILGSLFRSTDFLRNETELVIIVTPRLVTPARAGTLAAPTDNFVPPSDFELFALGKLRTSTGELSPSERARVTLEGQNGAGIDGQFGHVLH